MIYKENGVTIVSIDKLLIKYPNGNSIRQGWSPQCESYPSTVGKWGVLKTTAIQSDGFRANENKQLPDKLNAKEHLTVKSGDILVTCAGPRSRCGIPCYVEKAPQKLMISGKMYQLRVDQSLILPKYLFYFLLTPETQSFIDSIKSGSNDSGLNLTINTFKKIRVPTPSIETQAEITNQIEQSFEVINQGLQELFHAENKLELYRQSVLKDAFEGKLTADWREANPDLVESADKLLARIEAERKAAHQAELDAWKDAINQWEAKGKEFKKPYKPPPILSKFSTINQSDGNGGSKFLWDQICLGDLFGVFVGSTPKRDNPKYWGGSINWISSGEVDFCYLRATKETITNLGFEETSTKLHPPGTLFLAMIGEGKTRGKAAISEIEAAHNQNTAAIRISETSLLPEFFFFFMMYNYEITRTIGSGNNQKALNKARVEAIKVPLTCVAEQKELIDKIKPALEFIQNVKDELRAAEKKAEALKQSILKEAFSVHELLEDFS